MVPVFTVDLGNGSSIAALMDDIDRELVSLLCTKVGMLMEDHSVVALTIGSKSGDEQRIAIEELARTSTIIETLVASAQSIVE